MGQKLLTLALACITPIGMVGTGTAVANSHGVPFDGLHRDCDGAPYNNDAVIHDFFLDTVDSHRAYQPSEVTAGGLACGSEAKLLGGGKETFYEEATIDVPPGVVVTPTNETSDLHRYAGKGKMDAIGHILLNRQEYYDQAFDIEVGMRDPEGDRDKGCVPAAIACYFGSSGFFFNWNSVIDVGDGQLQIIIQHVNGAGDFDPGLAKIEMDLCRNFGPVDGTDCGTSNDPVEQYSGDVSYPGAQGCFAGGPNGLYVAKATQRDGTEATPDDSCVKWLGGLKDYFLAYQ